MYLYIVTVNVLLRGVSDIEELKNQTFDTIITRKSKQYSKILWRAKIS